MRKLFVCMALLMPVLFYGQDCEVCKLVTKKVDTIELKKFKLNESIAAGVSVRFVDLRSDTTKLGYRERKGLKKSGKEDAKSFFPYQLEQGTAKGFASLLSSSLHNVFPPNKDIQLVGFLRTFWISEYNFLNDEKGIDKIAKERNKLVFKVDYFLEKDSKLYAFVRIDTVFMDRLMDIDEPGHVLQKLLQLHVQLFKEKNTEIPFTRNGYTLEFIRSKTQTTIAPILQDTGFRKGIYLNFSEFLANNPSGNFKEVKSEKYVDVLYAENEKGEVYSVRDVWGFCDGKNLFIKQGYNFFQLARTGNTFELLGYLRLNNTSKNTYYGRPHDSNTTAALSTLMPDFSFIGLHREYFFPMQLDIQKGIVY